MSTLLSRIFGRKKAETPQPAYDGRMDVSALKPLMSPTEFAQLKVTHGTAPKVSSNPDELNGTWSMEQVLKVFPASQRALFQKFHIGGCNSCGYMPHDSLDKVARDHGLETEKVVDFIKESGNLEKDLEINPAEVAQLLKLGTIKLLDVRTPQEYEIAHIEGSVLIDQSLAQEIVDTWEKDSHIVTMCHHGMRSLDAAAYLRGHGLTNVQSMRGGIDLWSATVDSSVPRY
jgi:rhodanese-related sulfurtransferase